MDKNRIEIGVALMIILLIPNVLWSSLLPVSEDFSFYAYIAKSISCGWILHRDIPISTHSIVLYLLSLLFRLGADVVIVKIFYAILFFCFAVLLYLSLKIYLEIGTWFALIISVIAIFIYLCPHINIDIGRNYIYVSHAALMSALVVYPPFETGKSSVGYYKPVLFVVFLSLAFAIRETFLFVVAPICLYYIYLLHRKANYRGLWIVIVALLVNVIVYIIFVEMTGGLYAFICDIRSAGSSFRYGDNGLFDLSRIYNNVAQVAYGYDRFWGGLLLLSLFSLISKSTYDVMVWRVCYVSALFSVFVVNQTHEYHFQYLLPSMCVLSTESIYSYYKLIKEKSVKRWDLSSYSIVLLCCAISVNIYNVFVDYRASSLMLKGISLKKGITYSGMQYDIRSLVKSMGIYSDRISLYSNYPILLLANIKPDWSYPYLQDLSAHANMGRPAEFGDVINAFDDMKSDIYVDKSMGDFLSKWDPFGKVIAEKYVTVAYYDTREGGGTAPYKIRVMVSNVVLEKIKKNMIGYSVVRIGDEYEIQMEKGLCFISIEPKAGCDNSGLLLRSQHVYSRYRNELQNNKKVWLAVINGKVLMSGADIKNCNIIVYRCVG